MFYAFNYYMYSGLAQHARATLKTEFQMSNFVRFDMFFVLAFTGIHIVFFQGFSVECFDWFGRQRQHTVAGDA